MLYHRGMPDDFKRRFAHRWPERTDEALICVVTLDYAFLNGRIEGKTLTVRMHHEPLTTSVLRDLPVGSWMAADRRRMWNRVAWEQHRTGLTRKDRDRLRRQRIAVGKATAGRPKVTDELLAEVAEVYRDANSHGSAPTQAVADYFQRPRSTAAKWVQRARAEGFLGPAVERRAGEVRTSRGKR